MLTPGPQSAAKQAQERADRTGWLLNAIRHHFVVILNHDPNRLLATRRTLSEAPDVYQAHLQIQVIDELLRERGIDPDVSHVGSGEELIHESHHPHMRKRGTSG